MGQVRIGFFQDFKSSDTLLIDGDSDGLRSLSRTFRQLATTGATQAALHELRCRLSGSWSHRLDTFGVGVGIGRGQSRRSFQRRFGTPVPRRLVGHYRHGFDWRIRGTLVARTHVVSCHRRRFLAFSMVGTVATNAATILESQADEIAELRRQVAEQRSAA